MRRIKVGIIGTGGMAHRHARRYAEIRGIELSACYDVNQALAREFARRHDIQRVASSADDCFELSDAVSIVTPDAFHAPLSVRALETGKHLLCEKPLTTTLAEARRVARTASRAARRAGTLHMINFSCRDSSAVQAAIKIVQRGDLGDIRHVHASYLQSWLTGTMWGSWEDPKFLWRLQTAKGSSGVLGDLGCHLLDLITIVAGDVESLDCRLANFPKTDKRNRSRSTAGGSPLDANDTASMRLQFNSGAVGICHTTRWATGHTNSVELSVHGTEGALRIDLDAGDDKLFLCLGKNRNSPRWTTRTIRPTPDIYQRFIRSIKSTVPDQPDIVRGAQVQSYLDACQRSADKGGTTAKIRSWL